MGEREREEERRREKERERERKKEIKKCEEGERRDYRVENMTDHER